MPEAYKEIIDNDTIVNFFLDYMTADNIGIVANTQVAYGDLKSIFSSEYLELARLQAMAVDYPKTGVAV